MRIVHDERERVSHEMHDTLAQSLAGVGFKLQGILRTMRQAGSISESILEEVNSTCTMVASTHREASASIAALHPSSKTEGELLTLLERFVFSMVNTADIEVSTEQSGESQQLSPIVADTLLRVGKEAIANTLRHAKATHIKLSVLYRSRNLVLSIADNGVGFLYLAEKRGFGLKSIQTRCSSIKAQVEIISNPESGTIVRIISPYRLHRLLGRWLSGSVSHQS
jgi:signal transduction histidine kinase